MINELVALVGFSGFVVGMLIASKTSEEVRSGKKYFKVARKALLLLSALFTLNYIQVSLPLLVAGGIAGYFIRKPLSYYGAALGASATTQLTNVMGALTFLFGVVEGTIQFNKEGKKTLLIGVALFFGTYIAFKVINMEVLANAAAGAMLMEAFMKK